tara:strand:+ start:9225 stop:9596 length:372 start_codon:yes stop_codon:yes gene_type:complete
MKELTDLEICKKIAEIEGKYTELLDKQASYNARLVHVQEKANITRWFNPLTDDALCFKLICKYEVNIDHYYGTAYIQSDYTGKTNVGQSSFSDDEELNKAILLAIIEANNNDLIQIQIQSDHI